MLKNKKDWYPLLTFVFIVALRMLVWLFTPLLPFYVIIPLVLAVFVLYAIKHNHLHHSMFRRRWQNRLFEHISNVFTGTTFSSLKIVHLANHHHEQNKLNDWGHTKPFEDANRLAGMLRYAVVTPYRYVAGKKHWAKLNSNKSFKKQAREESIVLVGTYLLLLAINPWATLLFLLLPNLLGQFVLISFNFLQHSGCDAESPYNHSRNFTGKWLNLITFNNGYHTAHHIKPHLHWSAYPAFHSSIESNIDPSLNIDNFLVFLWEFNAKERRLQ